jgi:predicted metalloprotease with PDZ domain
MTETSDLSIEHRVSIPDPRTHLVHVETTVAAAAGKTLPAALVLFMPVWTPGSYLVREYARHVEALSVDRPARVTKVRKNAWRVSGGDGGTIVLRYRVYAGELTVRTCHVDETHALLVGAALFLGVEGHEACGAHVFVDAPDGWRAATALPKAELESPPAGPALRFVAPDFDALVDSPIELGTHRDEAFEVLGTPHRYAIWPAGSVGDADAARLVADTRRIVETIATLFDGRLPYEAYDLLLHLASRGRGGLEHGASACLIAPASSFAARDGYLDLLSLVAHEMFHAWNVKRIRPAGLTPYRYQEECYTRLLWWFEGGTSYYDWRVLALSRLATVEEYLEHLASEVAYLEQTPGRLVHALEDASFDAWIKLYRPDENSANSSVSYYRKGEVVCALLDLEIRARSAGLATLDTVLGRLWTEHGMTGKPVPEDGMLALFERAAGVGLGDLFDAWIRSPSEIDCGATMARVGLIVDRSPRIDGPPCSLGVRARTEGGRVVVSSATRDSAAWRAGIDAGDELVALAGSRVDSPNLEAALRGHAPGEEVDVLIARDGRVIAKRVTLDPPRIDRVTLRADPDAPASARDAFARWLGDPHPAWTAAHVASGT